MTLRLQSIAVLLVSSAFLLSACVAVDSGSVSDSDTRETAAPGVANSAAGAAASTAAEPPPVDKTIQVTDIPIPRDTRIDEAASIVIGSGDRWVGRVVMRVRTNAADTYGYFFNGMPRLGWTSLAAVQSKFSSLTFSSGDRIANLQIEGGVAGSTVTIVVSAKQP